MKFKLISAVFAMLVFSFNCNASLIKNGGFSSGSIDSVTGVGWVTGVNCNGAAVFAAHALLNNCGSASTDPSISQLITGLIAGNEYKLTWHQKNHYGHQANSFGVYLDGTIQDIRNWLPDYNYHTESYTFIASSTSHTIKFSAELDARTPGVLSKTDTSYYRDDISLVAVKEPFTFAVFSLGLIGLTARRKFKN